MNVSTGYILEGVRWGLHALLRFKAFSSLRNCQMGLQASRSFRYVPLCSSVRFSRVLFCIGKEDGVTDSFSRFIIDIACGSHLFAS